MGFLSLFTQGGWNEFLLFAVLVTVIGLVLLWFFNLVTGTSVVTKKVGGVVGIAIVLSWVAYFLRNFVVNVLKNETGIIIVVIILTIIFGSVIVFMGNKK